MQTVMFMFKGSTSFSDKTLAVEGGDVYILDNIYNAKLGIIVLSTNGVGGNIYRSWCDRFICEYVADGTVLQ